MDFDPMHPRIADVPLLAAIITLTSAARYFLFAGAAFLVAHVIWRQAWKSRRIQSEDRIRKGQIRREIMLSLSTILIFTGIGLLLTWLTTMGYTRIYFDFNEYRISYFIFSIVVALLMHDTYFYWAHRLMHWKPVFDRVHHAHHISTSPTPWAAFAFHPYEAVIEGMIVPIVAMTLPIHQLAILAFVTIMMLNNVIVHLGYELYPAKILGQKTSKWLVTATHHDMHHRYVRGNYGLYFNIWDQIMSTVHRKYEETFDNLTKDKP